MSALWLYGAALLALFPIVDPLTAGFSFATMTHGRDRRWIHRQAIFACLYMVIVLFAFQVLGTFILGFFAITLEAIRVAGGVMIWYAAIEMLRGSERLSEGEQTESRVKHDIAFTPMAMPLLSGPGAIAVTLSLSARSDQFINDLGIALAILTVAGVTYVFLRFASAIQARVSETGRLALTKILGFLLLCVSVQFIMSGIAPVFGRQETTTILSP